MVERGDISTKGKILLRCVPVMLFMLIVISFLSGCNLERAAVTPPAPTQDESQLGQTPEPEPEPEPIVLEEEITLTALGDILMHNTLIWSGGQPDGTYAFDFFRDVAHLMQEGDYCTTTLEAALGGPETGYTGYPLFNSPDAIAYHLQEYGVDGVIASNNHILDRGFQGAQRTVEVLEDAGLDVLGIKQSPEDPGFIIKDIRGIKVGYLAYTYGTNGLTLPQEHNYFINMLEKDRILEDIEKLRPEVDVLILILHWGVEYSTSPTENQRELAREFLQAGVDAIVGSHPHVVQPVEYINMDGQEKFVAYSIGNYIGHQRGQERNSGVILQLKFRQEKVIQPGNNGTEDKLLSESIVLDKVEMIPTFSHSYYQNGRQKFRVVPVEETIAKIRDQEEEIFTEADLPLLENVLQTTRERLAALSGN